ncbi:MAG: response regulator [Melioribacteraceae bacterium]|nr:response regulator [Melioribacteraceae bacterium]
MLKKYPTLPILIVDDEQIALTSLEMVLNSEGIDNLILCEDSREVMDLLSENKIGIVLLDLSMPHISGYELFNQISQQYPGTPIIIVSGENDLASTVSWIKEAAYDFLPKPICEEKFMATLHKALESVGIIDNGNYLN